MENNLEFGKDSSMETTTGSGMNPHGESNYELIGEDKYFTPNIEDIRVGYECEYLFGGENGIWTNGFGLGSAGFPELWEIKANPKILRVPYLTKEQIEAEGWKLPDSMVTSDTNDIWGTITPLIKRTNGNVLYCRQFGTYIKLSQYGGGILFMGECKDINTFRYICKLLNIK